MLNKYFDQTFLINLDKRTDRFESAKIECDRIGLPFLRVSAIDGSVKNFNLIDVSHAEERKILYSNGAAGLNLTVKKILEYSLDENYESVLILEDDVMFHTNFISLVSQWFNEIPHDWELIYFSTRHMKPFEIVTNNIVRISCGMHTHCWAIHRNIFRKCIYFLNKMDAPLDMILARDIQTQGKSYGFTMNLAHQKEGYSDIVGKHVGFKD